MVLLQLSSTHDGAVGVTNLDVMLLWDGLMDGQTDGQPENIMPPASKGRGIKLNKIIDSHRKICHHT